MTIVLVTVVKSDLKGLKTTADSVSAQSRKVDWLIVTPFNDSSTHEFARKLEISGLATKVIRDDERGIYQAMNIALSAISESQWVWYLNAGDEFADADTYDVVSKHVALSKSKWVYGSHIIANGDGMILGSRPAPEKIKAERQLFAKDYISHQATVFKKEILSQVGGFDEQYQVAADWDFIIKASQINVGEKLDVIMCVFKMGGYSTLNRQIGNRELLYLRQRYLPKRYTAKNVYWFLYRSIRNELVLKLERSFPSQIDILRIRRMSFRNRNLK
jgi:hypothetical protein